MVKEIILQLLFSEVTKIQFYGLIFLLGSFTVASLSDLRRMAAQKDFMEVWLLFTVIISLYDIYLVWNETLTPSGFFLKWILIVGFALASWKYVHFLFSLADMDIAAITSMASLLSPFYIIVFYLLLLILNHIMAPSLKKFGNGFLYPFLPVVFTSSVLILIIVILNFV